MAFLQSLWRRSPKILTWKNRTSLIQWSHSFWGFFSAGLRSCCGSFWKLPREEDCQRSVSRWIILHVKPDRHKHCFLSERLIFTLRIDRLGENKLPACKSIPENIGWSLRKLRERNKILFGALTCIYVHVQPLGCIYTFRILKGQFLLTCGVIYVKVTRFWRRRSSEI